ncbi:MAG: reverse transcriptase/maturase family protein [Patescibacteria group bacterium]
MHLSADPMSTDAFWVKWHDIHAKAYTRSLPFAGPVATVGGGAYMIMPRIQFSHTYNNIISLENLLEAWSEFIVGKRQRRDAQEFEMSLMGNIITLHNDLVAKTYTHSPYHAFNISDPKPRNIHKATVRDRLLHHTIYRMLYPFFDRTFIADSFSCRIGKGTHKALNRFRSFAHGVSRNNTRTCWVLKCDIRKFFANIDHDILKRIFAAYIPDENILWLLSRVVNSFSSTKSGIGPPSLSGYERAGLPLGNLTSQLFVNIYMNEFDQFMKHRLKAKCYIRYADDFVILSHDCDWLMELVPKIANFLREQLKLELHPNKLFIKTLASGIDFLGWVHFPDHRVLRTATKRRALKTTSGMKKQESMQSYLGLLSHGNAYKIRQRLCHESRTKSRSRPRRESGGPRRGYFVRDEDH